MRTLGPWSTTDDPDAITATGYLVVDPSGDLVADCGIIGRRDEGVNDANAEFIVRAVNSHEELLEACREMLRTHTATVFTDTGEAELGDIPHEWMPARAQAVAAIAKAEGGAT